MPKQPPKAAKPLRIKTLTLTDFRAFPGPSPVAFELDSKNLLVYGENGSGKSSIFHALRDLFSNKPSLKLREHKNVFSSLPDTDCLVSVAFNDKTSAEWTVSGHPALTDARVLQAALRRSCLDYRSLFDTNYKHGKEDVNLFHIAVEQLLYDFVVTVSGGVTTTIGELWEKVLANKPRHHTSQTLAQIAQSCIDFNQAFQSAFNRLVAPINELIDLLGWQEVKLNVLNFPGLNYNQAPRAKDREINGQVLRPEFSFRSHPLQKPQLFLNEARLSAL